MPSNDFRLRFFSRRTDFFFCCFFFHFMPIFFPSSLVVIVNLLILKFSSIQFVMQCIKNHCYSCSLLKTIVTYHHWSAINVYSTLSVQFIYVFSTEKKEKREGEIEKKIHTRLRGYLTDLMKERWNGKLMLRNHFYQFKSFIFLYSFFSLSLHVCVYLFSRLK